MRASSSFRLRAAVCSSTYSAAYVNRNKKKNVPLLIPIICSTVRDSRLNAGVRLFIPYVGCLRVDGGGEGRYESTASPACDLGDGEPISALGDGVTSTVASGDGVPSTTDSDGDGEFIVDSDDDDGAFAEDDDDSDDGVFPVGDGDSAVGEGLSDDVQTLSVVVEPATLSISDELHAVQLIQETWLDVVEYCPLEHATHFRSVVAVPLVEIYSPATQLFQFAQ